MVHLGQVRGIPPSPLSPEIDAFIELRKLEKLEKLKKFKKLSSRKPVGPGSSPRPGWLLDSRTSGLAVSVAFWTFQASTFLTFLTFLTISQGAGPGGVSLAGS